MMESWKQLGLGANCSASSSLSTTSSSFASELFGSKETSSSELFGSFFPPPSKVHGNMEEALRPEGERNQDFANEGWKSNSGTTDDTSKSNEGASQSKSSRDVNYIYQEQRMQPCHLSSSIYYGGQENYSFPQNQNPGMNPTFKKDAGEDDPGSASRGNWWQGGLYY